MPQEGGGAGRRAAPRGRRGGRWPLPGRALPGECPATPHRRGCAAWAPPAASRAGSGRPPVRWDGEGEPLRRGGRLLPSRRSLGTALRLPPARVGGPGAARGRGRVLSVRPSVPAFRLSPVRRACGHGVCLEAGGSTWKCRAGGGFRPVKHSKVGQERCKWVLFVHLLLVRTGKCAAASKSFLWRR